MYCPRCDKHFGEEYVVCPECGDALRQETNNFESPVQNQAFNGQIVQDKGTTFIILSILELLCCNLVAGIVALVFAIIGSSNFKSGRYDDAARMWKGSKIALWVGLGLTILGTILSFVFVGTTISSIFSSIM